jgi:phosphohistidine phosphatase
MLPLYFLRHADAEPVATGGDSERALTMKGIAQAKRVGEFCARTGIAPAAILYSPYRRTMETAEIVGKHLGIKVTAAKFLASGMRPEAAFDELNARRKSDGALLLVGHEPDFSELIGELIGVGGFPARIVVKKASLLLVEADELRPGGGYLVFSLPVKLMM